MNILFLEPNDKGIYYSEFASALKQKCNVFQYGPGFHYYDANHTMEDILPLYRRRSVLDRSHADTSLPSGEKPDLILFGFGWENDNHQENYTFHNVDLQVKDLDIKKAFIINKEYKKLAQKFSFIRENNIDVCFTVLHTAEDFGAQVSKPFFRMNFAANKNVFKDYGLPKTTDVGFSGNMFNSPFYKETDVMGPYFQNIRERMYAKLGDVVKGRSSLKINWNHDSGHFLYGEDYSKLINRTKIWLNTPSAIDIVGTRFYEVIASHALLFCRECPWAYKDIGLVDGETCVTFKTDLSDFQEKLLYYLENDIERQKIVENAYDLFINNHTWEHRVDFLLSKI